MNAKKHRELKRSIPWRTVPLLLCILADYADTTSQVKLYKIDGGGHVWPGEPEGQTKFGEARRGQELNASEVMWEYFERITG